MAKSYVVRTFGCQMNEHDSERISGLLDADGYEATSTIGDADEGDSQSHDRQQAQTLAQQCRTFDRAQRRCQEEQTADLDRRLTLQQPQHDQHRCDRQHHNCPHQRPPKTRRPLDLKVFNINRNDSTKFATNIVSCQNRVWLASSWNSVNTLKGLTCLRCDFAIYALSVHRRPSPCDYRKHLVV